MKIVSEIKKEIVYNLMQTFSIVHKDLCLPVLLLKPH